MKNNVDMINGKILPNLAKFSIPIMFSGILQMLYSFADSIIVGRYDGALSLAAVGSTGSITGLFIAIFMGMSLGSKILVATAYGAGNKGQIKTVSDTSIVLSLVFGIFFSVLGLLLAKPLAYLVGLDSNIIDMSVTYMRFFFLGIPFSSLYNYMGSVLVGMGDSKTTMIISTISGALNVVLNFVFVKFFKWGVAGVAIATDIANLNSFILVSVAMKKSELKCKFRQIKAQFKVCMDIIRLGFPVGLQTIIVTITNVIVISCVNSLGTACVTANSITNQLSALVITAGSAISQATTPFTSQNIGANKPHRINKVLFSGIGLYCAFTMVIPVILYIFRLPIIEIFVPGNTNVPKQDIIYFATITFHYYILPSFMSAFCEVPGAVLRGMGKTTVSFIMTLIGMGICIIWQLFVFPIFRTPQILYLSYPIQWASAGIAMIIAYIICKRKFNKKMV